MNKAFEKILERLDEAIKESKELQRNTDDAYGYMKMKKGLVCAKGIVEEVAEEYNGGWIPCSEKLPEECIEVLVSVKEIDGSIYTRTSFMQDGVWVIKKTPLHPTVIAWQPLPEPYKESE